MKLIQCLVLLSTLFIVGCQSSPLKSDLEIQMNEAYDTNFDYIDTIELIDSSHTQQISVTNHDQIKRIMKQLTQVTASEPIKHRVESIGEVVVMTSEEGEKYNSRQRIAKLEIIEMMDHSTKLRYNNKLHTISTNIVKLIQEKSIVRSM